MDPQRRPAWSPFFSVECAVAAHSRPTLDLIKGQHLVTTIRTGTSQGRIFVWVALAIALMMVALAIEAWLNPFPLPEARPLRWIARAVYELGGRGALAAMWGSIAVAIIVAARSAWRHTPKVPTDRWWRL